MLFVASRGLEKTMIEIDTLAIRLASQAPCDVANRLSMSSGLPSCAYSENTRRVSLSLVG